MLLITIILYFIVIPVAIGEAMFGFSVLFAVILYGMFLFSKRFSLRLDKHAQKAGSEMDKVVLTTSVSLSAGLVVHNYVLENTIHFKELRLTLINAGGEIQFVEGIENVLPEIPRLLDHEGFALIVCENDDSWPTFIDFDPEENELSFGYTRYNEAGERIPPKAYKEKIPVADNPMWRALVQKLDLPLDTIVEIDLEDNSAVQELVTKCTFGDLLEKMESNETVNQ